MRLYLTPCILFYPDLVPSASNLAALAVIVAYYDQLEPEQEEFVGKSWHRTECFSLDNRYASRVSDAIRKSHQDPDFMEAVAAHEEALLKICEHCMPFNYSSQSNNVHSLYLGEHISKRGQR